MHDPISTARLWMWRSRRARAKRRVAAGIASGEARRGRVVVMSDQLVRLQCACDEGFLGGSSMTMQARFVVMPVDVVEHLLPR